MRLRRVVLVGIPLLIIAFAIYLGALYSQLKEAFVQSDEFIPTRIYSDVSKIHLAQPRSQLEDRLRSLGYLPGAAGPRISFELHKRDYPDLLVPTDHPQLRASAGRIQISVEDGLVSSIELDGQDVAEIYLEPELVATLSRSGEDAPRRIRRNLKLSEDAPEEDQIPTRLWRAVLAVEDHEFLEHAGWNPKGFLRAMWVNLRALSFKQGGSTITQQLVKNLMARKDKNVFRKANEILLSILLELTFEKEEILERYLNEVNLGQVGNFEVRGVGEATQLYFGKRPHELNLGEMAFLAGIFKSADYYSPHRHFDRAKERQRIVLRRMVETGHIVEDEMKEALGQPIRLAPPVKVLNKAPYFTDYVKARMIEQLKDRLDESEILTRGLRIYTTLDMSMNAAAQRAVSDGLDSLEKRLKVQPPLRLEGALASVDHASGQIRALVGGRSYAHSTFNRILNMRRQVGSTFKPIVYLSAILKGEDAEGTQYGPGYPAEDAPFTHAYDGGRQKWSPKNDYKEFKGWISMRQALAFSVNTVTARIGTAVGVDKVIETARGLGITSALPEVPSLVLGVAELSPVELLRAYATIANHGMESEFSVIRRITEDNGEQFSHWETRSRQAVERGPADLLVHMLETVFTDGTAKAAAAWGFDRPAAGKTGTTNNNRDAWFAGFTPQLTTVVWVGMDQMPSSGADPAAAAGAKKAQRIRLSGTQSALPIWTDYMKQALAGEPRTPFELSEHLVDVPIDRFTGRQAMSSCPTEQVITEKYVKGHEPQGASCEGGFASPSGAVERGAQ